MFANHKIEVQIVSSQDQANSMPANYEVAKGISEGYYLISHITTFFTFLLVDAQDMYVRGAKTADRTDLERNSMCYKVITTPSSS